MDFSPLTAWLSSLGPWGIAAAVALGYFGPKLAVWLKAKLPSSPAVPGPAIPGPAPLLVPLHPADPLANRPVLGMALALLQQLLARNNPGQDAEQLLVNHLLGQVGTQVIVPPSPAERMTGARLADRGVGSANAAAGPGSG